MGSHSLDCPIPTSNEAKGLDSRRCLGDDSLKEAFVARSSLEQLDQGVGGVHRVLGIGQQTVEVDDSLVMLWLEERLFVPG